MKPSRRIFMHLVWTCGIAVILYAGAGEILAQEKAQKPDPAAMAGQYAANAKQNATIMQQYAWEMRVEVSLKDETKPAQLYQLRYDLDGKLQKTLLTAPQEEGSGRGIRGRIKKGKIEDFKEWANKLAELVKEYMTPSPGTMMDFYAKAHFTEAADGSVQITADDFIQPGDKATYWIDPATKIPHRYVFETTLDEDAVSGQVDFGQVPDGPQYAARIMVEVPSKQVSAKIENYNYQRQ